MRLVLATNNPDKIKEITALLTGLDIQVLSKKDFPDFPDIAENAETLDGNALLKAEGIYAALKIPALADDTGLEVDALNGAPGVYSARYSGENATYADNCRKLLTEMTTVPRNKRGAKFRCVIAICWGDKTETVEGVTKGEITTESVGDSGFGYDPVFYYPPLKKTFAEMSLAEKNEISHRGRALRKARELIQERLSGGTV